MYKEESAENLRLLSEKLVVLQKNPSDLAAAKDLFRAAHTLTGISSSVGFQKIADLTKPMEKALSPLRDGKKTMDQDLLQAVYECGVWLRRLGDNPDGPTPPEVTDLVARLGKLAS